MSLLIWLPLDGDLHNQGLSEDLNFTATGTVADDNAGKIGKCKSFSSSNLIAPYDFTLKKEASVCLWVNWTTFPSSSSNDWLFEIASAGNYENGVLGLSCYHGTLLTVIAGGKYDASYTHGLSVNTWNHIAFVWKNTIAYLYINGELKKTYTNLGNGTVTTGDKISLGSNVVNSATRLKGKLNDVRVYDHALSAKEVHDIAQGLILHYPLDSNFGTNLIKNGYGELGNENWGGSVVIDSNDLPDDPKIKASFKNSTTTQYIPIDNMYSYKFQVWLKSSSTSGTTYPSFYPYDIDKKFIGYYHTKSGFNLNTMTKLKNDLKPGDNKIYVEDLSEWNANSGHYYNYAAIFGYADSTGYVYPDGVYTQNTPAFGSSTNAKTNLDKTNNIITLNSTYNGQTVLAGTSVCASTNGSTYFYPIGGISRASLSDWTFKTSAFNGDDNRLIAAKYLRYSTYDSVTANAGIKLINSTTLNEDIIYDTSGYGHDGDIIGEIESINPSPKYNVATHFPATTSKILIENLTTTGFNNSYTFSWWGKINTFSGKMFWGFADGIRLNGIYNGNLWNTGNGTNNPLYKPGTTSQVTPPSVNAWHHFVMVGNGTTCLVYLDGKLWGQAKACTAISGTKIYMNGWDSGGLYTTDDMSISDFRIYCTALSAQDIKLLYEVKASGDRNNNFYSGNFQEI